MHAPYVLRIRTVSNSDDLFGAYDPSTALSIRTVTIRTDRTDRNTLCSDVIMRCTLRMCSEYGPLATLTVCTQSTIRQLLLRVRNSATLSDMTAPCCAICTTHRVYGIHVEGPAIGTLKLSHHDIQMTFEL